MILDEVSKRFWQDVQGRFWKKVLKSENCWIWSGGNNGTYGTIQIYGRAYYAHRVSFELNGNVIEENKVIMHSCDNPLCVNPNHLFMGSQLDNMRDKMNKGRYKVTAGDHKGIKNAAAKINDDTAFNIRKDRELGMSIRKIGKKYTLSPSQIFRIVKGESWQINL